MLIEALKNANIVLKDWFKIENPGKVLKWPNAFLSISTTLVPGIKICTEIANEMAAVCFIEKGVALAANQIGYNAKIIVVDSDIIDPYFENEPVVFIDPVITSMSEETNTLPEGCLSFPNIYEDIKRATSIWVTALDLDFKEFTFPATDLFARAILHEVEHLKGYTLYNHMSLTKRSVLKTRMKKVNQAHTYTGALKL